MNRLRVRPKLLHLAGERAGWNAETLKATFLRLRWWGESKARPTLKQFERFANGISRLGRAA